MVHGLPMIECPEQGILMSMVNSHLRIDGRSKAIICTELKIDRLSFVGVCKRPTIDHISGPFVDVEVLFPHTFLTAALRGKGRENLSREQDGENEGERQKYKVHWFKSTNIHLILSLSASRPK